MGEGQPFLYNPPMRYSQAPIAPYSSFDPKAVTRASLAPPPPPKPKQEGPLLSFNRHPDNYLIVPYGNLNAEPMHPSTKSRITSGRKVQAALRIIELIGAIGMLICVICVRGTTDNEGWILRLPPVVDILTTVYAIYHLSRAAKGRTPGSSASYHFFALFMDAGLIPFYVFTAMLTKANYQVSPGTDGRWRSFFDTDDATTKLLLATWLTSMICGALHILSFLLDTYLMIMFRKISQLPPDLNPLEDNLTSRRKNKHKYKDSSVTDLTDKRISDMTTGSAGASTSHGIAHAQDPLIDSRMSFFKSRSDENGNFSPHNPNTARLSQVNMSKPVYQQSHSARGSHVELERPFDSPSRIISAAPSNPTMSKRTSIVSAAPVYDDDEKHEGGNWDILGQDDELVEHGDYDPYRTSSAHGTPSKRGMNYQSESQLSPLSHFAHQPLGMNPPTPESRNVQQFGQDNRENDRTHTMASGVSALSASSVYSTNETTVSALTATTGPDAPKTRYYGDLAAAMRGVRQHDVVSPGPKSMVGSLHNAESELSYGSRAPRNSRPSPATAGDRRARPKSHVDSVSGTVVRKPVRPGDESEERGPYPPGFGENNSPRVISRSGADYLGGNSEWDHKDRREVSGKIAEEGRGGWRSGMFMRKSSRA